MGNQSVHKLSDPSEKRMFTRQVLNDIYALESMINDGLIETGIQRIGAEQELALVDLNTWQPSMTNIDILKDLNHPNYTTEMARFNLEINLDPLVFEKSCFSTLETDLVDLIKLGEKSAAKSNAGFLLTGILPTILKDQLYFEQMTPNVRYEALNDTMMQLKGGDFELNISGIDELITQHPNILFEACNTSFQVHLQLEVEEFVDQYNWSQLISGPVLAMCSNSPLLLGKRLWHETRIALFQQSVDIRNAKNLRRVQQPRVTFGNSWLRNSVLDLFKDNVSRYNLLFAADIEENSIEVLEQGGIPQLNALRLHNGTVYKWNRPCYGVGGGKPHLRIENRYIPSGPTVTDEIANSALWLGLMKGMPEKYKDLKNMMSFEEVRYNFYSAAQKGFNSHFNWFGKTITASNLMKNELLPLTIKGLESMNIDGQDINKYIGVIENRIAAEQNGSKWIVQNFGELLKGSTPTEAAVNMTELLYKKQNSGKAVHEWRDLETYKYNLEKDFREVAQIMETELYTVHEDELLDLVINVMNWQNIRHIPVENDQHEMVGMIDTRALLQYFTLDKKDENMSVKHIMKTDFPSINKRASTAEAVDMMADKRVDALAVVDKNNRLIGIITESDVVQVLKMTKKLYR
jgi:CBS domain-containing protein